MKHFCNHNNLQILTTRHVWHCDWWMLCFLFLSARWLAAYLKAMEADYAEFNKNRQKTRKMSSQIRWCCRTFARFISRGKQVSSVERFWFFCIQIHAGKSKVCWKSSNKFKFLINESSLSSTLKTRNQLGCSKSRVGFYFILSWILLQYNSV